MKLNPSADEFVPSGCDQKKQTGHTAQIDSPHQNEIVLPIYMSAANFNEEDRLDQQDFDLLDFDVDGFIFDMVHYDVEETISVTLPLRADYLSYYSKLSNNHCNEVISKIFEYGVQQSTEFVWAKRVSMLTAQIAETDQTFLLELLPRLNSDIFMFSKSRQSKDFDGFCILLGHLLSQLHVASIFKIKPDVYDNACELYAQRLKLETNIEATITGLDICLPNLLEGCSKRHFDELRTQLHNDSILRNHRNLESKLLNLRVACTQTDVNVENCYRIHANSTH